MGLGRIAARAAIAYVYLLVMGRISGKRVVGQSTPFDFLVALIIGDLVDDALWAEVSMARFGAATSAIFVVDAMTTMLAFRSRRFFRLVNGTPPIVLKDGIEDPKELRREQLNELDLAHLLRLRGIERWNEVKLAIIGCHELSVIRHWWSRPVQKKDREAVK